MSAENTSFSVEDYVRRLKKVFETHGDPALAVPMARYMKNRFPFLGLKAPQRSTLTREFLRTQGLPPREAIEPVVRALWDLPQREYHYAALDILERFLRRKNNLVAITFLEELIINNSWWDTVDWLATRIVGVLFRKQPALVPKTIPAWMKSQNLWLQRVCLLFQLKYKDATDERLLWNCIEQLVSSPEFFIQKAIGWALREYSKTNPQWVKEVVSELPLAPLSKREATRLLP